MVLNLGVEDRCRSQRKEKVAQIETCFIQVDPFQVYSNQCLFLNINAMSHLKQNWISGYRVSYGVSHGASYCGITPQRYVCVRVCV